MPDARPIYSSCIGKEPLAGLIYLFNNAAFSCTAGCDAPDRDPRESLDTPSPMRYSAVTTMPW
jgi:hypothetical protein